METGARVHIPVSVAEMRVSRRFDTIPSGTLHPNADEIKYLQRLVKYKASIEFNLHSPLCCLLQFMYLNLHSPLCCLLQFMYLPVFYPLTYKKQLLYTWYGKIHIDILIFLCTINNEPWLRLMND